MRFVIGRGPDSDIQIDDPSVSRRHAELVVRDDGRYFLSDSGSSYGSFRLERGAWVRHDSGYVEPGQALRFGVYEATASKLLAAVDPRARRARAPASPGQSAPQGPVERDPETGEIVPRK